MNELVIRQLRGLHFPTADCVLCGRFKGRRKPLGRLQDFRMLRVASSPSFLIVNGGSHAERESPKQSRPGSLAQRSLPSRGPPCTSGTWSPTALSS